MFNEFLRKIDKLYKGDQKKLKTGTILYGNLYDDRWQTHIQKPLDVEELNSLEIETGQLPDDFKEFLLTSNGCYLFDLLRVAGKQDGYKGMAIEEQIHQPISFRNILPYLSKRKLPEDLFVFADSMVNDTFFAYNGEGRILQMNLKNFRAINTYHSLLELMNECYDEGEKMVFNKQYIEFE